MPPVLRFLVRRILSVPVTLLILTAIVYWITTLAPPLVRVSLFLPKGGHRDPTPAYIEGIVKRYGLNEQDRMIREFTEHNTCDQCYVSIRSYLDKSFPQLLRENVTEFFSFQ